MLKVPIVNARHRSANDTEGRLTISRLNSPVNNIPNVDGTIWLIAMIQEAQRLDMERLSCLIDVDSVAATGQRVNVACVDDMFAVDFEAYGATAVELLASYTIRISVLFRCLTRCFLESNQMSHTLIVGDGRSRT